MKREQPGFKITNYKLYVEEHNSQTSLLQHYLITSPFNPSNSAIVQYETRFRIQDYLLPSYNMPLACTFGSRLMVNRCGQS